MFGKNTWAAILRKSVILTKGGGDLSKWAGLWCGGVAKLIVFEAQQSSVIIRIQVEQFIQCTSFMGN